MSKVQINTNMKKDFKESSKMVFFLCLKDTIAGTARNSLLNSHLTEKVPLFRPNDICSKKEKLKVFFGHLAKTLVNSVSTALEIVHWPTPPKPTQLLCASR